MICIFLIITFFFGPLGGGVSNLPENNNITPVVNAPENIPPVTPLQNQEKEKNNENNNNIETPAKTENKEKKEENINKEETKEKTVPVEDKPKEIKENEPKEETKPESKPESKSEAKPEEKDKPSPVENPKETKEDKNEIKEEPKAEDNNNNKEKSNNENNNNQEKEENEEIINLPPKKKKFSWKKLFFMGGFLSIIYYLIWNESNNPQKNDDDEDDDNKDQKNKKKEKDIKITINNLSIETIKSKMFDLDAEIKKKCGKAEAMEIYNRCKAVDDYTKDLNFKFEALQQFTEKLKSENAQITKKIEFLSGEYSKLAFKNSKESQNKDNHPLIDLSKIVDTPSFENYKKENLIKFDKIRQNFDEFTRRIEEIFDRLSHTPTDKDFAEFQNLLKNMIEELKISSNKKYADKYEVNKTYKYLETQIKTISDSYTKKSEGADNWLLAKKPIGNYMCASCESILKGNLDKNKDDYIPWNKYPNRDEKSYRMGHGFSRMLQLVNDDIMKTVEKGYSSDEEKKSEIKNKSTDIGDTSMSQASGTQPKESRERAQSNCVKLPKVKNRNNLNSNMNIDDNSTINDNNNPYGERLQSSDTRNNPQIMKIYKLNKHKTTNSSNLVSPNLQVNNLVINSLPNEEE